MKKSIASIAGFLLAASLLGCAQSDIDVPDVVGQKADDAKDVLMDSGFYNVDMVEEDGDAAYVAAAYTVVGRYRHIDGAKRCGSQGCGEKAG